MTFLSFGRSICCVLAIAGRSAQALLSARATNLQPPDILDVRQAAPAPAPLRNFQVQQPPIVPQGGQSCTVTLLDHTFGNSYGKPAVVKYAAPTCAGDSNWASVVFNFTATSKGSQYDRLASLYLNEVEIWRTSTAEPIATGIVWTALRDMTKYRPLLQLSNATLLLSLNNILDPSVNLTGEYDVTLSATYYAPTATFSSPLTADSILPLSKPISNDAPFFSVPPTGLTSPRIPQNAASAFAEIFASGNGNEEFWYTNLVDAYIPYVDPSGKNGVIGRGPFREVQLWIDNHLAGAVYPYPVIFTGGIILTWWRPMCAYGAFDQPTYTLDITPFLPLLTDGATHNFTLTVEGQGPNRSINDNWFLSGNVALTLDPSGKRTTGSIHSYATSSAVDAAGSVAPGNKSVEVLVTAKRELHVSSILMTGSGGPKTATLDIDLQYSNRQFLTDSGLTSVIHQSSTGTISSTLDASPILSDDFSYPLSLSTNFTATAGALFGTITHGLTRELTIPSLIGYTSKIDTTQDASGNLTLNTTSGRATGGVGETREVFDFVAKLPPAQGGGEATYHRDVAVANRTIVHDEESGSLAGSSGTKTQGGPSSTPGPVFELGPARNPMFVRLGLKPQGVDPLRFQLGKGQRRLRG